MAPVRAPEEVLAGSLGAPALLLCQLQQEEDSAGRGGKSSSQLWDVAGT